MFKILSIFFLLAIHLSAFSQMSEKDNNLLREELASHVNQLRISLGLTPLLLSDTLAKAAQNQSDYMASIDEITHDQKKSNVATPDKRVEKYGGNDFEIVGENVLHSVELAFPLNNKQLKELAASMFLLWKKSPLHYANMINAAYKYGDFGFSIGNKRDVVFATQVFGSRGAKITGQITSNSFGIEEYIGDCSAVYGAFSNIVANMGNSLKIEGNEVVLYYHNQSYFDEIFPGPNDGIAVDIVSRDQFLCGQPNRLDISEVHDGILLKPVYRKELLAKNSAENVHRLITTIGVIPENIPYNTYVASIVLIRDGKKCKYLVPSYIPSEKYELRPIEPVLVNPQDAILLQSGIVKSQEIIYNFNRGKQTPTDYPIIIDQPFDVHSVHITCHTSVEGDSEKNAILHDARGEKIKNNIQSSVRINDSLIYVLASENWKEMRFQFKYLFADDLLNLSNDSVKALIINQNELLPWDSLLFEQRKSFATINYKGELSDSASDFQKGALNLRTAITMQDFDLANRALYEIYQTTIEEPAIFFEGFIFEALKKEAQLVQNAAAIYARIYEENLFKTTAFINNWIVREDEISLEALANILHLYTLIGKELLLIWDLPSERLSNVIHPARINKFISKDISPELALNLHLTAIQYFGQINDGVNITKSFDYIVNYFENHNLTLDDEVDLCLFFNSWSRYDLTTQVLMKRFKANEFNEDGLFILAQTMYFYNEHKDDRDYRRVHEKAMSLNQQRWCNWVNQDFQILRDPVLKTLYCSKCE